MEEHKMIEFAIRIRLLKERYRFNWMDVLFTTQFQNVPGAWYTKPDTQACRQLAIGSCIYSQKFN